jgi:hypothetical protein
MASLRGDLGDVIGLREYGFTVENVYKRARALLEKNNA